MVEKLYEVYEKTVCNSSTILQGGIKSRIYPKNIFILSVSVLTIFSKIVLMQLGINTKLDLLFIE